MTIFDDFTDYGRYKGEPREFLNEANFEQYVAEYGHEWVMGYLKALEAVAIDVANILQPSEDIVCGLPQTPHMVRTNLRKYWSHNKTLLLNLTSQIEQSTNKSSKPTVE